MERGVGMVDDTTTRVFNTSIHLAACTTHHTANPCVHNPLSSLPAMTFPSRTHLVGTYTRRKTFQTPDCSVTTLWCVCHFSPFSFSLFLPLSLSFLSFPCRHSSPKPPPHTQHIHTHTPIRQSAYNYRSVCSPLQPQCMGGAVRASDDVSFVCLSLVCACMLLLHPRKSTHNVCSAHESAMRRLEREVVHAVQGGCKVWRHVCHREVGPVDQHQ